SKPERKMSAISIPKTTPSAPSNRPASRTVSRWDPIRKIFGLSDRQELVPTARPTRLPMKSVDVCRPASCIQLPVNCVASRMAGDSSVRVNLPGSSVTCANLSNLSEMCSARALQSIVAISCRDRLCNSKAKPTKGYDNSPRDSGYENELGHL